MSHRWALYLSLNLLASSAIGCAVVDSRNSRFTVANTTTPLTLTGYSDTPNMPLYLAYYVGTNPSNPDEGDPASWSYATDAAGNPIVIATSSSVASLAWNGGNPGYAWSTNTRAVVPSGAWIPGVVGSGTVPLTLRTATSFTGSSSAVALVTDPATQITSSGTNADATVSCPGGLARTPSEAVDKRCLTNLGPAQNYVAYHYFFVTTDGFVPFGARCYSNIVNADGTPAKGNCALGPAFYRHVGSGAACVTSVTPTTPSCSTWSRDMDCNGQPDIIPMEGTSCSTLDTGCGANVSGVYGCQLGGAYAQPGQGCTNCTLGCHVAVTYCGGQYGINGTNANAPRDENRCGIGTCTQSSQCRPGFMCDTAGTCVACTDQSLCPNTNPNMASIVCYPPLY